MIKELIKLSNHLDSKGHRKEADYLDAVINKIADGTDPTDVADREVTRAEAIKLLGGGTIGEKRYDEIMSRSPDDPCKVRQQAVYDNVLSYVRDSMQEGSDKNMLIDWLRMTGNAPTKGFGYHQPSPTGSPITPTGPDPESH